MGSLLKAVECCGVLPAPDSFGLSFYAPTHPNLPRGTKYSSFLSVLGIFWAPHWPPCQLFLHLHSKHELPAAFSAQEWPRNWGCSFGMSKNIVETRDNVSTWTSNVHLNVVAGTHLWLHPSSCVHAANSHFSCHILTMQIRKIQRFTKYFSPLGWGVRFLIFWDQNWTPFLGQTPFLWLPVSWWLQQCLITMKNRALTGQLVTVKNNWGCSCCSLQRSLHFSCPHPSFNKCLHWEHLHRTALWGTFLLATQVLSSL